MINSPSLETRLRLRLLLISLLAIVGIANAIAAGILLSFSGAQRDLEVVAASTARDFDLLLNGVQRDLMVLGDVLAEADNPGERSAMLRASLRRQASVFQIIQLSPQGELLAQRQRTGVPREERFTGAAWLPQVLSGEIYWSEVYPNADAVPFVDMAVPILQRQEGGQRRLTGILLARIDLSALWMRLAQVQVGDYGYAYLMDSDGFLLAFRDMRLVRENQQASASLQRAAQREGLLSSVHNGLAGEQVLSSVAPLSTAPWIAVVEQPVQEIAQQGWHFYLLGLLVLLGVSILVLDTLRFSQRRIVQPLLTLRHSVEDFRQGDLSQRVSLGVRRGDELDALATTFNRMAASIQQRTFALVEANERARESARLKTEFLHTISHELRTPLNAIMGYTGLLLEGMGGSVDEEAQDILQRIDGNGTRLLEMINEMLDVAKAEAGRMKLHIMPFSPYQLVEEWRQQMQALAAGKGLAFELFAVPTLPPMLIGDAERIRQIVTHLLSNAFKFTEQGKVRLQVDWEDAQWRITVQDTGIGIDPKAQAFIFDEFRQVDGSMERRFGGAGLGLALVKKLTTLMGGTVELESRLGQGTQVQLRLPLVALNSALGDRAKIQLLERPEDGI